MSDGTADVTSLLLDERLSDSERAGQLFPIVYDRLRRIAGARMANERSDHTLQATALVHEAYLKLVGDRSVPWQSRAHFFGVAAEAMRQILLDHARAHGRVKRGGRHSRVPLGLADLAEHADPTEILSLDEAICRLQEQDPAMARVVQLRFFAGLSIDETAGALGTSPATVKRQWEFARTWLFRELSDVAARATDGAET
jgi:RNA polymerase sigma factor (TIGR02999 family)